MIIISISGFLDISDSKFIHYYYFEAEVISNNKIFYQLLVSIRISMVRLPILLGAR